MKGLIIENPDNDNGDIGTITVEDGNCIAEYTILVVVSGTCWVEFDISSANVVITKVDETPFINGEQLTQSTGYNVTIYGWRSSNEIQNVLTSSLTTRTKDSEGGLIIEESTIERYHTGDVC